MEPNTKKWEAEIAKIKEKAPEATVAIVATEKEVKNLDFKSMIPESGEEDFMADLKMSSTHWFYF